MKVVQKALSFLHYFHAAISNHLSEKQNMSCYIWSLNTGLTVLVNICQSLIFAQAVIKGGVTSRGDAILMSTHNIGFYEDLTKNIFELSSNIIK